MTRGLPASYVTALTGGYWREVLFVSIALPSATLRVHSYVGDITWGGFTWSGVGTFGSIGILEEGEVVSPYALQLTLSHIDTSLAPEILNGTFTQSAVLIYFGMLGEGGNLLGESNAAQAGTSTTITLATAASSVDSFYNGKTIRILSGTGAGSTGLVTGYVGSTRVATISSAWGIAPASGSVYSIDDAPVLWWSGKADLADVLASRTDGAIGLTCESDLAAFDREDGSLFSEAELKKEYSTETFFQYLAAMQDRLIEWKETRGSSPGLGGASGRRYFSAGASPR